jgi:4-aminobutyrate aminotransferase-like enzyme
MEFFSTFGGNTVSSAIGLEVLSVVHEENLQAHALEVGNHLLDGLRALQQHHEFIREVRGSGLFLGVELGNDNKPATLAAENIVNRMRDAGVLLGTDGPHHNVLKTVSDRGWSNPRSNKRSVDLRDRDYHRPKPNSKPFHSAAGNVQFR